MDVRSELRLRDDMAKMFWKSLNDSGMKLFAVAKLIGKSPNTVSSWMSGNSFPKLSDVMLYFDCIGVNIMRYVLEFYCPDIYCGLTHESSNEDICKALHHFIDYAMPNKRKKLLDVFKIDCGVDPIYNIHLFAAHSHTDMRSRISTACAIYSKFELDQLTGDIKYRDCSLVNTEYLNHAITLAVNSVSNNKYGYTTNFINTIDVSSIIKKAREDSHKTNMDLAHELGVSRATVTNWENGNSEPNLLQLYKMFSYYGLNIFDYIFLDDCEILEEEIKELHSRIDLLDTREQRLLLYMMIGEHGSSWFSTLELMLAHCLMPMKSQLEDAQLIMMNHKVCQSIGMLVKSDHQMADLDMLNDKIIEVKRCM